MSGMSYNTEKLETIEFLIKMKYYAIKNVYSL